MVVDSKLTHRRVRDNIARKIACVGTWSSGCRRCFLQLIDQAKATPMVGSLIENSVAEKVCRKIFRQGMGFEALCDEGGVVEVMLHGH